MLDLHGYDREMAARKLESYIVACHGQRLRHVLVITGKGPNSGDRGPGLRDMVQRWAVGAGSRRGGPEGLGRDGLPVRGGWLAYGGGEVSDRFVGGDQTLVRGAVLGGELLREAAPLLFYQGGYQRLTP